MASRSSHSPLFPDYRRAEFPDRNLFFLEGNLYDETEGKIPIHSMDDLYDLVFNQNGMVYTKTIASREDFPWLDCLVHSPYASVLCDKKGKPLAIMLRNGNRRRWIALCKTWNVKPEMDSIKVLRQSFDHIGAGVAPTPGGLGRNVMRQTWKIFRLPSHTAPSGHTKLYIRENMVGGRVDTPGLGNFYDVLLELDMFFGYMANHYWQVTDAAVPFKGRSHKLFADFFARCVINIPHELAIGPFPVRVHSAYEDRVVYPTLPGVHTAYLWAGQVSDAERAGCTVRVIEGYGWRRLTDNTGYLAEKFFELRDSAPSKDVEGIVKQVGVSYVGGLGMSGTFYTLVPEERAGPKDNVPLVNAYKKEPLAYFVHEEERPYIPQMVAWYSRTITETARKLYKFALPFAEQGRLVATNYDSVLVVEKDDEGRNYLKKYTEEDVHPRPGDWRATHLHHCFIVAPRAIECDEKSIRPGVEKEGRESERDKRNKQFVGRYARRGTGVLESVR